jgi:hypothetical protein
MGGRHYLANARGMEKQYRILGIYQISMKLRTISIVMALVTLMNPHLTSQVSMAPLLRYLKISISNLWAIFLDILSEKPQVAMKPNNVTDLALPALDNTTTPKESEWDTW